MKPNKILYRVTLDWPDEGDFCEHAWATDAGAAIREIACRMADSWDLRGKERKEFIEGRVASAGSYAAERVAVMVKDMLNDLLVGPKGVMTDRAREMHRILCYLIEMEGVM